MTLRLFPIGAEDFSSYDSYEDFYAANPALKANLFGVKYFPAVSSDISKFDYTRTFNGNPSLKGTYRLTPNTTFGYETSYPYDATQYVQLGNGVYARTRFELSPTLTPTEVDLDRGLVISQLHLGTGNSTQDYSRLVINDGQVRLVYYRAYEVDVVDVYSLGSAADWYAGPKQVVHAIVPTATPHVYEVRVYLGSLTDTLETMTLVGTRQNTASAAFVSVTYTPSRIIYFFDWWFQRPTNDNYAVWVYTTEYGEAFESDTYETTSVSDVATARLAGELLNAVYDETLSQGVSGSEQWGIAYGVGAIDGVTTEDTASRDYRVIPVLSDSLAITTAENVLAKYRLALDDAFAFQESSRVATSATSVDAIALSESTGETRATTLTDLVALLETVQETARLASLVAEAIAVADTWAVATGAALTDAGTWADEIGTQWMTTATIADLADVSDAVTPHLVVRAIAEESLDITVTQLAQMLLGVTVQEQLQLDVGLLLPQSLITWAINARTGAVTTYTNYPYTSFARRGATYLATAPDGLYVLHGNTDNGSPIIAELQSGFMQFAGSRFTSFKAIYLGVHGSGEMFFRLTTGDDKTYTYRVIAQDMETTKVRVGKGLRARYFAFSLVTTGQDFDLDTVEFYPIGAQRRV